MNLSRKIKRASKRKKSSQIYHSQTKQSDLYYSHSPFTGIPPEEMRKAIIERAKEATDEIKIEKENLFRIFSSYDPLHILTTLASHALTTSLNEDGKDSRGEQPGKPAQAHVELAQAIALSIPANTLSFAPIPPAEFQIVWDGIIKISDSFMFSRFSKLADAQTDEDRAVLQLCERLRVHTQYVRNWGYYSSVIKSLKELYLPLDINFKNIVGLEATKIIDIFEWMVSEVESRNNEWFAKLAYCFSATSKRSLVERYYESFSEIRDSLPDLISFIKEKKLSRQGIISLLISHSDFLRTKDYQFSLNEVAQNLNVKVENIGIAFEKLSYKFGDLENKNFEYLFLDNPIQKRPLIKLSETNYFCALPQAFFSFSLTILDSFLLNSDADYKKISERRSNYLEEKIARLFREALPGATILKTHKWKLNGVEYETDLIVKYDSQLYIVEAKSGSITEIALRGAIGRVKKHLEQIIYHPAIQAKRLEDLIHIAKSKKEINFDLSLPFNISEVQTVTSLAVTLEDFATLQANTALLPTEILFGEKLPAIPTILHSDLEIIFDVLESPAERVHYLNRRKQILKTVKYQGDELDLLGFYIATGFCVGEIEKGEINIQILGMSEPIDNYYIPLDHGIRNKKPKRKITKWFQDMVSSLEKRKPRGWTELAFILLCTDYNDQINLEKEYKKVCRNLEKQKKPKENQLDTVTYIPPSWSKVAMTITAYFEEQDKYKKMENSSAIAFDHAHVEVCAVICCDLEGKHYPYSTFAIFNKKS
jgi:hypothetical protein